MKKKIIKGILLLATGFIVFFAGRLIYGYIITAGGNYNAAGQEQYYDSDGGDEYNKKNYASTKTEYKGEKSNAGGQQYDQKYEKVGAIKSRSEKFSESEQQVRQYISKNGGIIQYEQNSGLEGNRHLKLTIGVPPANFDTLIQNLRKVGKVLSISINKVDKTNEYKVLNAERTSLEKTIQSLYSLKSKPGKVDEFMNLENRIMELETQLQELGVKLGEFDQENEFCTVRYSLDEREEVVATGISFMHRVSVALEWTIRYYTYFVLLVAGIYLLVFLGIRSSQLMHNDKQKTK